MEKNIARLLLRCLVPHCYLPKDAYDRCLKPRESLFPLSAADAFQIHEDKCVHCQKWSTWLIHITEVFSEPSKSFHIAGHVQTPSNGIGAFSRELYKSISFVNLSEESSADAMNYAVNKEPHTLP